MNPTDADHEFLIDRLKVSVYANSTLLGSTAARAAGEVIREAISHRGAANIILATGNSQLDFLQSLRTFDDIDWTRVTVFHMDEYLDLDPTHPASFPLFLQQHFLRHVNVGKFFPVPSNPDDLGRACQEYTQLLRDYPVDLVAMGFGENGHIAFNDPPFADFNDPDWVKVVELDEVSRRQQVGEGHFTSLDEVPLRAITLTIPALLAPRHILCMVPEARKAAAVHACLTLPVSEERPGSVLRTVDNARLFLDRDSASTLDLAARSG